MVHITVPILHKNQQISLIWFCVAWVSNLSISPCLQNMFFRMSLKIFALILLLNVIYIIFVVFNIGHLCLTHSDVTLLKSNQRANFKIKRHNDQISKFFSKGQIILDFFNVLINIRKIFFNSRTLYTSPIYFAYRFWKIYTNKVWFIFT